MRSAWEAPSAVPPPPRRVWRDWVLFALVAVLVVVEGVFTRYMAGDVSLIEEVRDNAASDAPVNVIAREALEQEPVNLGKRKQTHCTMYDVLYIYGSSSFVLMEENMISLSQSVRA